MDTTRLSEARPYDTTIITGPNEIILQPFTKNELDGFERYSWVLKRCIDFSTHLIHDYSEYILTECETTVGTIFRALVVRCDGIRQMILSGSGEQGGILLRSVIESGLSLLYCIKDISKTKYRTECYRYSHILAEISEYRFIANTKDASENIKSMAADRLQSLERIKAGENFRHIQLDFDLYRKEKKKRPNWYSLDGGPSDFLHLAKHLNFEQVYYMYKKYSQRVHATDGMDGIFLVDDDFPVTTPLRFPKELPILRNMTVSILIKCIDGFTETLFPAYRARYQNWYDRQIKKHIIDERKFDIEWIKDGSKKTL